MTRRWKKITSAGMISHVVVLLCGTSSRLIKKDIVRLTLGLLPRAPPWSLAWFSMLLENRVLHDAYIKALFRPK